MTMSDLPKIWLKLRTEAPEYAGKGGRFLAREANAGRLKAARIGGRGELVTRREWIDEWIESQVIPQPVTFRRAQR
jgi:hypothetical protein